MIFDNTMDMVRNRSGEHQMVFDIQGIEEGLVDRPRLLHKFRELVDRSYNQSSPKAGFQMIEEFYKVIPKGIGKVYLKSSAAALDETNEIDMQSVLALARKRNCLDMR